jgi:hypothetical protein
MPALPGRKVVLTLADVIIRGFSKHDNTMSRKTIDCTEYDPTNNWERKDVGFRSAKMTVSGFLRVDDPVQSTLRGLADSGAVIQNLKVYHDYANGKYFGPDLEADPTAGWVITDLKVGAAVTTMVTCDFTLESFGPIKEF